METNRRVGDVQGSDAERVAVLTERLSAQEKIFSERIEAIERVYAVESAAIKMALDLQAKEYERRLELLNSAHDRAEKIAQTTLTIKDYEPKHQVLIVRIEALELALHDMKLFADGLRGNLVTLRTVLISILVPLILFIVGLLWALLTHRIEITP
jgi:hypothetical protein